MTWLPSDISKRPLPPLVSGPGNRSPELLEQVIDQFDVESAERYRVRDITGDGRDETFCNVFFADVAEALGAPVPRVRANDLLVWLEGELGRLSGWKPATGTEAQAHAELGGFSGVLWGNPHGPGHVSVLRPAHGIVGVCVASAGAHNANRCALIRQYGTAAPLHFFTHP